MSSWLSICVLSLTWACSQQALAPASAALTSCNYQLDVVFAVDLSNSISRRDFSSIKSAMVTLIGGLRVSEDDIHVGLVTFSSTVTQFPLSGDKNRIIAMINSFVFLDGSTQTQAAINVATNLFADKARGGNVRKLLIVITDGRSDNPSMTLDAANNAKHAGISIYTVGVGSKVIEQELQLVATSRNQVFRSENFQDLGNVLVQATSTACTQIITPQPPTPTPPACYDVMDLVIAIDGSNTITEFNFEVQKAAIANLVRTLRVSTSVINVGLVVFSGSVTSYQLRGSLPGVLEAIYSLRYLGGETRTDLAINEAVNLFRGGRGGNIKRLLMIITYGRATNQNLAVQAAQNARSSGITIYTVGVSNRIDRGEMEVLASSLSLVLFTNLQALPNGLIIAMTQACTYVPPTQVLPPVDTQECFQMDFVIAMDSSNSISPNNFQVQKGAIVDLVRNLRVSPQDINVGFVDFSNRVETYPLTGDKATIMNQIALCEFMDDSTNTDRAIDAASGLFNRARGGAVRKILLIVTDGKATDRNRALQSARNAKAQGISIYVVGVTDIVDRDELTALASAPSQVFYSNDFQSLRTELSNVASQACSSAPPGVPTDPAPTISPECLQLLDFIIAIDASSSITQANFELQRRAIATLVTSLQISPLTRRVGLVLFSTTSVTYPLSGNSDEVLYNINQMEYLNDLTNTYSALNSAYQMFLNDRRGFNVRRILIIVTDGRANDPTRAGNEAQRLKDAGVTIYSVGVADNVNRQELANLASSPSQVLMSNNFQTLQNDLIRAASEACNYAPPTIPTEPPTLTPECFQQLDFVIVIDSSDSIERGDFQSQKDAISNLVTSLQVTPNEIHVGLVLFSDTAIAYPLSGNQRQILNDVNNFEHLDSSTMTHLAIDAAYRMFQTSGRTGVKRILIIITDGRATSHNDALIAADRVKAADISIYAVGVGTVFDFEELQDLASSPGQVKYSSNFQTLQNDLIQAASEACRFVPLPNPPTISPVIPTLPPTLPPQCFDQLDFVIAIDSSNSIGRAFDTQRQAIANLVENLGVTPNGINVGMVLFSTTVTPYRLSGDQTQVLYDIRHLEYLDDGTMTGLAINAAIEVFQSARSGVTKILMIVTDGKASDAAYAYASAQRAKNADITIYVVGVTNRVNRNELISLASAPNMVFYSNDFQTLQNSLIRATTQACVSRSYLDRGK